MNLNFIMDEQLEQQEEYADPQQMEEMDQFEPGVDMDAYEDLGEE